MLRPPLEDLLCSDVTGLALSRRNGRTQPAYPAGSTSKKGLPGGWLGERCCARARPSRVLLALIGVSTSRGDRSGSPAAA